MLVLLKGTVLFKKKKKKNIPGHLLYYRNDSSINPLKFTDLSHITPKICAFPVWLIWFQLVPSLCQSCRLLFLPSKSLSKVSADSQSVAGPVPLTVRAATRKLYSVPRSRPATQTTEKKKGWNKRFGKTKDQQSLIKANISSTNLIKSYYLDNIPVKVNTEQAIHKYSTEELLPLK